MSFYNISVTAQVLKPEISPSALLHNPEAILAYANTFINKNSGKFQIQAVRHSPHATYYTLEQTIDNIPIVNLHLKFCVSTFGVCNYITGAYYQIDTILTSSPNRKQIPLQIAESYKFDISQQGDPVFFIDDSGSLQFGNSYTEKKAENGFETLLIDENNEVVFFSDHRSYFMQPDSTVNGNVFLPDPLTTANTTYGGAYTDHNDSLTPALQSEQANVSFKAFFDGTAFYLKTDSLELKDFASPAAAIATSATPAFVYSRADAGFEDVNTFYHITTFNNANAALGYALISNFYLQIDPHGAGGADQSFFVSGTPPSIQYGEGGVDDAEDADVIIHEYTHALSDHASPGSNSGFERRAVDEGYGDYFAVSYSRSYSDFNWQNVFSWDGHNEFWSGRDANTTKHYPEDVGASLYDASEIWSGALMDIYDAIGKENTDKLVLENMYGSVINMSMPEAALLLLNSEAILFDSLYHTTVFDILHARGLLYGVDIEQVTTSASIQILNTYDFTFSDEPLHIILDEPSSFSVSVTDVAGRSVFNELFYGDELVHQFNLYESGVYLLIVETASATYSQKLMKF